MAVLFKGRFVAEKRDKQNALLMQKMGKKKRSFVCDTTKMVILPGFDAPGYMCK